MDQPALTSSQPWLARRLGMRGLDAIERLALLGLYSWLVVRLWPQTFALDQFWVLLLFASEGLVVLLLLLRKPALDISRRWQDWALALGGTFLPLFVVKGGAPLLLGVGAILMATGLLINVAAKISLWRSFGLVAANRGVRRIGAYRFVRHPMYLGYMMTHAGFLLVSPSAINLAIYAAVWTLLVLRIRAEERVLMADPEYRDYATRVRARLVPGLY